MKTNDQAFHESMRSEGIDSRKTFEVVLGVIHAHFTDQMRFGNGEAVWARRHDDAVRWQAALKHYVEAKVWAHLYLSTSGLAKAYAADDLRLPEFVTRHEEFLVEYAELNALIDSTINEKTMADSIGWE